MPVGGCGFGLSVTIGAAVGANAAVLSVPLAVAAAGVAEGHQVVEGVFATITDGADNTLVLPLLSIACKATCMR